MKIIVVAVAAALSFAVSGCGKKAPPAEAPVAPTPPPPAPAPSPDETPTEPDDYARLSAMSAADIDAEKLFEDVRFDYDRWEIRDDARAVLAENARTLKRFDFVVITLEGHCDERGSVEYNLALGERRARAVHDYLGSLGVPAARMRSVSYGKEAPVCTEATEACWARNRRTAFRVTGKTTPGS